MHGIYVLSVGGWILAFVTVTIVGISKTGLPVIGILFAPLFAEVLPSRASTGALLPLIIMADVFAILFWRRYGSWKHLVRLFPLAFVGVVAGYFAMGRINDRQLRYVIGVIVVVMLGTSLYREYILGVDTPLPTSWWFASIAGFLAGATTMMANAGGPVAMIYLVSMRLPKKQFIGTCAWFFFVVNWVKVPFSLSLGLITGQSLLFDSVLSVGVVAGVLAGLALAYRIPEKVFMIAVQILTFVSGVMMFF
jgi:hypothetical protein